LYSYRIAGLSVASDVALPGVIPASPGGRAPEATIARGRVPASLDNASASGPAWQIGGDRFLLRIPDVARFLLVGGHRIIFELEGDTPDDEVAIFLTGTVFGILLHQRGQIVLHASAVEVGGKAVLFCGSSGAGKSTLAAALAGQGYPLVADDVCAVALGDDARPLVHPDGRRLKLWSQAIAKLELTQSRDAPVRRHLEKFYVEPGAVFSEPLPLGAIYVLREARPPHQGGIARPNVVDCSLLLRRNAYRPLLIRRMNQGTDYFHAAAAISNAAGIFHLTRALDFARMGEVVSLLRDHWAEIGLLQATAA